MNPLDFYYRKFREIYTQKVLERELVVLFPLHLTGVSDSRVEQICLQGTRKPATVEQVTKILSFVRASCNIDARDYAFELINDHFCKPLGYRAVSQHLIDALTSGKTNGTRPSLSCPCGSENLIASKNGNGHVVYVCSNFNG